MLTHNLGYPRIGARRELKKASEKYWAGKISQAELLQVGQDLRRRHWQEQDEAGIDLIPVNDFSFYDQVLDLALTFGVVPERYQPLVEKQSPLDLYFAMARGHQAEGIDVTALEMTKWFDTNYHYLVPEFSPEQEFTLFRPKVLDEWAEAQALGIPGKPVLVGPVSFLRLGKASDGAFAPLRLLDRLLPIYIELLQQLQAQGATWVQLDEPCLALDLTADEQAAVTRAYQAIRAAVPDLKILLANYFDCYGDNLSAVLELPVDALHLDLVRCPAQWEDVLGHPRLRPEMILSLGVVDGRNIWRNDFRRSIQFIEPALKRQGRDRVWIAPSCSLLHSPHDLRHEEKLDPTLKHWMAFARQKLDELALLKRIALEQRDPATEAAWQENYDAQESRRQSEMIHRPEVQQRLKAISQADFRRASPFVSRQLKQQAQLGLPLFPTTTIGSFPQTTDLRQLRARHKKGELSTEAYEQALQEAITQAIRWQEEVGLDVLVHGEFERNDMVEYFGEHLNGYAFTQNGWVQSYGSRCVKPPIIFGDVARPHDISVRWSRYAQDQTERLVKGMLTGPITMLQWSFVRDDQPRSATAYQLALAIRDEVQALEAAGIRVIQIDEPAIREGLPLQKKDWPTYLDWAIKAFRLAASGVQDETQIHTHMCYSEFNDIIDHIAELDADVITIETSRSRMELLDAFVDFHYPNEIGPGVYDIHSPRVPSVAEISDLLTKARQVLPPQNLWVNPDCGLKTRRWEETRQALQNMVAAARQLREAERSLA